MNIAIIPARSGSKRIPKKNIKSFCGKPMLAYAVEAAKQAELFNVVMVSTDSEEIARIAKEYGAEVPFLRSEKNSSDTATTYDVIEEVLCEYQKIGKKFATVCCIYPCVPFLTGETLKKAFSFLENHDSVIPVCKFPVPTEWAMQIDNSLLIPSNKNDLKIRSQDLIPKYYDAGMFYFSKPEKLKENHGFINNNTYAYILSAHESQDIDTADDWRHAEIKYMVLQHENRT